MSPRDEAGGESTAPGPPPGTAVRDPPAGASSAGAPLAPYSDVALSPEAEAEVQRQVSAAPPLPPPPGAGLLPAGYRGLPAAERLASPSALLETGQM